MPKFVDIETPYMSSSPEDVARNIRYARACLRHSLSIGETPFASHLIYTQPGILDDNLPQERETGIRAGKEIIQALNASTVVYTDLGISEGMKLGIELARKRGRNIEYRILGEKWEQEFLKHENKHSQKRAW